MYDLICDVITCCVWSCDTGIINAFDKIMCENQKKEIYENKKNIFHMNLHLKDRLHIEFTASQTVCDFLQIQIFSSILQGTI